MSQLSLSLDSSLLVRDVTGDYRPANADEVLQAAQQMLRDRHGIEVLTGSWSGRRFLRLSAHLYNTPQQLELCTAAVAEILQQERRDR